MEIDRIDWHWDAINDNVSEEEHWERAGAHIGYYIEWAYKKGFAPNNSEFNDVAEYQKVINSEESRFMQERYDSKEKGHGSYQGDGGRQRTPQKKEGQVVKKYEGGFDVKI